MLRYLLLIEKGMICILNLLEKLKERFADKSYDKFTTYKLSDTTKVVVITHYDKRGVPTYRWSYMADMDDNRIVHLAP